MYSGHFASELPRRLGSHLLTVTLLREPRSRLAAVELLLGQGLGKRPTAEVAGMPSLPHAAAAVEAMSWSEMQHVFAITYADDCARSRAWVAVGATCRRYARSSTP